VILAQSIITVWFIRLFIKSFFSFINERIKFLIVGVLTATTSIGITVGMLMPDFTTFILIIGTALILFADGLNRLSRILILIGIWFSVASHHSHAYILLLILIFQLAKIILQNRKLFDSSYTRISLLAFVMVIGYFTIPSINYFRNNKFVSNESSSIFLMGRINQMGLLKPFLDEKCLEEIFSICEYRDNLPSNFLWDKNSPVYKDQGWNSNNQLYTEILRSFFQDPKYMAKAIGNTIQTGLKQFISFKTVKLDPLEAGTWPQYTFERFLPKSVRRLSISKQNNNSWNNQALDIIQSMMVTLSFIVLLIFLVFQNRTALKRTHLNIILLLFFGLLANAFICGGISMIAPRFQSRIIWLVPFISMCLIFSNLNNRRLRGKND